MSFFLLRTRFARFGVAVLLVVLDVAARWGAAPVMGDRGAALFVIPAVLAAAMLGGFWPGVVATMLGMVLVDLVLLPPVFSLRLENPADWIRLGVFLAVGVAVSLLAEYGRRIYQSLQAQTEALQRSEERLRFAADAAHIGMFEWDIAANRSVWTAQMEMIHGMEPGSFTGEYQHWLDRVHPDDRDRAESGIRDALQSGFHNAEWRVVWRDGSVHWIEARGRLYRDSTGKPARMIGVNIDITARKKAEQDLLASEANFRALVEHAPEAVFVTDREGVYVGTNANVRMLLGYTPEEFVGKRVQDLIRPEEFSRLVQATRSQPAEVPRVAEWDMRHKEGHYVPVELSARLLPDNRWVAFARDISRRKAEEAAVRSAMEVAEAANRAKDKFLAALSHELRTPLNPVLMLAGEQSRNEDLHADVRADFSLIRQNVELEVRLIDDLLDLTRITRGKLELRHEQCRVHELLHSTLRILEGELAEKQVTIIPDLSADVDSVQGDPVRLQQVFWNVLRNAVRFTPKRGTIRVRTSNPDKRRLLIAIADSGIGIAKEDMDQIFVAFDQGASGHRFGGLGLGLTISRSLVEAHGGSMRAESDGRDRGATFTVDLPVALPSMRVASMTGDEGSEGGSVSALRILLVEDHEPTRTTLNRLLERRGHNVKLAGSIATARELAAGQAFDLLISDLGLPDGDGCALMSELSAAGGPPGVALSGYGMEDDIERSRAAGFSAHLIKPVDMEMLDRVLSSWPAVEKQRRKSASQ